MEEYVAVGQRMRDQVLKALPDGWGFEGRRILDFGCGAGRLLRQFTEEAEVAEFHGSDTDAEMIGWVREHLCPPVASASVNASRLRCSFPIPISTSCSRPRCSRTSPISGVRGCSRCTGF